MRDVGSFELRLALGGSEWSGGITQKWGAPIGLGNVLFFGTWAAQLLEQEHTPNPLDVAPGERECSISVNF